MVEVEEGAESPDLEAKAAGERGAKRKVIQFRERPFGTEGRDSSLKEKK